MRLFGGWRRGFVAVLWRQSTFDRGANFFHQAFATAEILRLDGRVKNYFYQAGLDGESGLRHGVVRTDNRHRDHGNAAFHREIEGSLFEGEQLAIERAVAFDVDDHIEAVIDDGFGGAHGLDAGVAIPAVDGNHVSHAHGTAEDRGLEQFFFHHSRGALGDQRDLNRRVEIRDVVRHEDEAASVVEAIESDGLDADTGDPYAGAGAPHEETIKNADVSHDERRGEADDRRDGSGQGPEDEHEDGANHFARSTAAASVALCASPFNQAARRARCGGVTGSRSFTSYITS